MCVCTWKSTCMYVCGCVYMFMCVYMCISVCMHACTCMCTCLCACMGPSAFAYLLWLAVGKKPLLQSLKNRIRIRTRTHFSSSKDLVLGLEKVSCHFIWVFVHGASSFGSEASYPDKDAMCKHCFMLLPVKQGQWISFCCILIIVFLSKKDSGSDLKKLQK